MSIAMRDDLLRQHPDYFRTFNAQATAAAEATFSHYQQPDAELIKTTLETLAPAPVGYLSTGSMRQAAP